MFESVDLLRRSWGKKASSQSEFLENSFPYFNLQHFKNDILSQLQSFNDSQAVSYTHLTLPTIYSV